MSLRVPCLLFISLGLVFLGCQDGKESPVEPANRIVEGAGPVKCTWAKSDTDVYLAPFRSDKKSACETIVEQVSNGDAAGAEEGINLLLVALSRDYGECVGGAFGTQDLANCPLTGGAGVSKMAVVNFAKATCDLFLSLAQTGNDIDCVVPSEANLVQPDQIADKNEDPPTKQSLPALAGGWIAVGPVGEGAEVKLPNLEYAIKLLDLENSPVFVSIRENPATPTEGACQGLSDYDCESPNYVLDIDYLTSNDPIVDEPPGLYVEMCEVDFGDIPGFCEGGECFQANSTGSLGLLNCSKTGIAAGPSIWSVLSSELANRAVHVDVRSQSAAGSAGTVCTVFPRGSDTPLSPVRACTTEKSGQKTSDCTIGDVPAADANTDPGEPVLYTMKCEKLVGTGSHKGEEDFFLSQTSPPLNGVKTVGPILVAPSTGP